MVGGFHNEILLHKTTKLNKKTEINKLQNNTEALWPLVRKDTNQQEIEGNKGDKSEKPNCDELFINSFRPEAPIIVLQSSLFPSFSV